MKCEVLSLAKENSGLFPNFKLRYPCPLPTSAACSPNWSTTLHAGTRSEWHDSAEERPGPPAYRPGMASPGSPGTFMRKHDSPLRPKPPTPSTRLSTPPRAYPSPPSHLGCMASHLHAQAPLFPLRRHPPLSAPLPTPSSPPFPPPHPTHPYTHKHHLLPPPPSIQAEWLATFMRKHLSSLRGDIRPDAAAIFFLPDPPHPPVHTQALTPSPLPSSLLPLLG